MRSADAFTGALWCPRCHVCLLARIPGASAPSIPGPVTCDRHIECAVGDTGANLVSSPTSVLQKRHYRKRISLPASTRPCTSRELLHRKSDTCDCDPVGRAASPRRATRFQSNLVHVVACADDIIHPPIHSSLAHNGYRYCTRVLLLSASRTFFIFHFIPFRP